MHQKEKNMAKVEENVDKKIIAKLLKSMAKGVQGKISKSISVDVVKCLDYILQTR